MNGALYVANISAWAKLASYTETLALSYAKKLSCLPSKHLWHYLIEHQTCSQALGWTTLNLRRHNSMLCLVHLCCSVQAPTFLCSKLRKNSDLAYAGTRGSTKLHLLRPKTNYYHTSFEFQGAMHYNKLPSDIRNLKCKKSFKAALLKLNTWTFLNP